MYICIICYDTIPGSKYVMIFHVSIHIQMFFLIGFFTGLQVFWSHQAENCRPIIRRRNIYLQETCMFESIWWQQI